MQQNNCHQTTKTCNWWKHFSFCRLLGFTLKLVLLESVVYLSYRCFELRLVCRWNRFTIHCLFVAATSSLHRVLYSHLGCRDVPKYQNTAVLYEWQYYVTFPLTMIVISNVTAVKHVYFVMITAPTTIYYDDGVSRRGQRSTVDLHRRLDYCARSLCTVWSHSVVLRTVGHWYRWLQPVIWWVRMQPQASLEVGPSVPLTSSSIPCPCRTKHLTFP